MPECRNKIIGMDVQFKLLLLKKNDSPKAIFC